MASLYKHTGKALLEVFNYPFCATGIHGLFVTIMVTNYSKSSLSVILPCTSPLKITMTLNLMQ